MRADVGEVDERHGVGRVAAMACGGCLVVVRLQGVRLVCVRCRGMIVLICTPNSSCSNDRAVLAPVCLLTLHPKAGVQSSDLLSEVSQNLRELRPEA